MLKKRTALLALVLVCLAVAARPLLAAQQTPFPLTDKLKNLAGTWIRDPTRGAGGICGVTPIEVITVTVSASEVTIDTGAGKGTIKLDGSQTTIPDGRTATAALDAGWLAVTMRRSRQGATNVMREVYIPLNGVLTIWRTLNVVFDDGREGKIDCGNHAASVYTRK